MACKDHGVYKSCGFYKDRGVSKGYVVSRLFFLGIALRTP